MRLDIFGRKAKPPQEIADLRLTILEDVKKHIVSTRGTFEFPWNYLTVDVIPKDEAQANALNTLWVRDGRLQSDVRDCLKNADCKYPDDLAVQVNLVATLTPEGGPDYFAIAYNIYDRDLKCSDRRYQLVVLQGHAHPLVCELTKTTTFLGRRFQVVDNSGALIRSNDVAFAESGDDINSTVAREHAKILHNRAVGEFRLYETRKDAGTQIVRDGKGIRIPYGGRGEPLRSGDEIWLGKARLSFEAIGLPERDGG